LLGYLPQCHRRKFPGRVQRLSPERGMSGSTAILLIDDNEDDVFLFERALKALDLKHLRLHSVRDVQTAQCYLLGDGVYVDRESYPTPQLIFLDWFLPRVRGNSFLSWAKSHPQFSALPVVVMSSDLSAEETNRILAAGASAVVVKPAQFEDLKRALKTACGAWLRCGVEPHSSNTVPANLPTVPIGERSSDGVIQNDSISINRSTDCSGQRVWVCLCL
jgi:CheY-like chemotaxis protein